LLPTQVRKLHNPFAVDDKERRTLAQGKELALDLVLVIQRVVRVHQAGERDCMVGEVGSCFLWCVSHNGDNHRTRVKELLMLDRQLTEVSSTERSHEAPKKHQHHTRLAAIVTQGDIATHRVWQREIRSLNTNRDEFWLDCHSDGCLSGRGLLVLLLALGNRRHTGQGLALVR